DHAAFDQLRLLEVLRKHARCRVGEAEARIKGVVRVVAEVDIALESEVRHAAGAGVLRLETVIVVEAALDRMSGPHLGQTDGDILGPVDVQKPWKDLIRRPWQCAHSRGPLNAAAPPEGGWEVDPLAVEPDRIQILEHAERVVAWVDDPGIRVEERKPGQTREAVRGVVDEDATGAGSSDRGASGELVADEAVRALQERRRIQLVVHRHAVVRNVWI